MPTKDDLTTIDIEHVKSLLSSILYKADRASLYFVLQQLYELSAIIISSICGCTHVKDKVCVERIQGWNSLLLSRNITSHNFYDKKSVLRTLRQLYNSTVLLDVCREALDDETLAYPMYYLIGHVLKTGELF